MDGNMPGYRTAEDYIRLSKDNYVNSSSTKITYPMDAPLYRGETHYINKGNLLRLDPSGNFRSLYPTTKP